MTDPYAGISPEDRVMVDRIARAMGNGMLGPHNRTYRVMARRVLDDLKHAGAWRPDGHAALQATR